MEIRFVSDYVCPYCLVAKEALLRTIRSAGISAAVIWHPFELTEEPKERVDTYHDAVRRSHYQALTEPCRQMGLDMKLPPHVVPRPYTRLAFEGFFEARHRHCEERYNDLVYRAYFMEEQDIGDPDVLCAIAQKAGMNPDSFRAALTAHTWSAAEKEAVRSAKEDLHVRHVPTILIDGEEVSPAAYTQEAFAALLTAHSPAPQEDSAMCCGSDGCGFSACGQGGCGPDGCQ